MIAEEKVRHQLQALIKQIGLKDQLKKHLRVKLTERLQRSQDLPQFQITSDSLRHRIISSVIKEHLDKIGCACSASVFAAESLCDQKMLSRTEIIQLLNTQPVFQGLSLLQCIIEKSPGRGTFLRSTQTQTDEEEGIFTLEQKFTMMDLEYRRALEQKNNNVDLLSKGHNCQEEKKWYEKELFRFKEFEGHKIKVRVGEEWRIKFQNYAEEMEKDFRKRIDRLRHKEKSLAEEYAAKEKTFEQKTKNWESSAKSRLEMVQMKENSVSRQKMNLEVQRKRALDYAKKALDEAKEKGRQYEGLLLNVQKRIDYEVGVVKLSLEQAQSEKEQQFVNRRKFVDEQYGKLMGIKDTMDLLKVQNERLLKENTLLRDESQQLRQEVRAALSETSSKGDRLDLLRGELTDLKNEKKEWEIKMWEETKQRQRRQRQVIEARKQLQGLRRRFEEDDSESSVSVEPRSRTDDLERKMVDLRNERKKDIERFKLEI